MLTEQRSTALARFLRSSPHVHGVKIRADENVRELDWRLLARLMPEQARRRLLVIECVKYNVVWIESLISLQQPQLRIDGATLTQQLRDFPNIRQLDMEASHLTLDELVVFVEHALRIMRQLVSSWGRRHAPSPFLQNGTEEICADKAPNIVFTMRICGWLY